MKAWRVKIHECVFHGRPARLADCSNHASDYHGLRCPSHTSGRRATQKINFWKKLDGKRLIYNASVVISRVDGAPLQTKGNKTKGRAFFHCKSGARFPASTMTGLENPPTYCNGLKEIAEKGLYDVFLLDQFGVLHDGKHPYPEAISTMEHLSKLGIKNIIISNSSRRASYTIQKLNSLGFNGDHIFAVITSGELTYQNLLHRNDPFFSTLGKRCLHFNWKERGLINLDELNLEFVESVEDADFILVHGIESMTLSNGALCSKSLDDLKNMAMQASKLQKNIPMIIANPDLVTVEKRELRTMPGTLGMFYENLGGKVVWMGKPGNAIYKEALRLSDTCENRCLAIGDSLHHDINGAQKHSLDSVFVAGGIHFEELELESFGKLPELEKLSSLCMSYEARPTFVIPCFQWE